MTEEGGEGEAVMIPGVWQTLLESFRPGTSEVDWCEPNYASTSHVAEFYNTTSNLPYLVVPATLAGLFRGYTARLGWGVQVVWGLLLVVGVGSIIFHGTLSLAGQLLDELAILWLLMAALTLWTPRRMLPPGFSGHRTHFQYLMTALTVLGTWLGCRFPIVNHVALFFVGAPYATMVILETSRSANPRAQALGRQSFIFTAAAVTIWILDKHLCPFWLFLGFPYVHGLWHVAILIGGYEAMVFMSYRAAEVDYMYLKPDLRFWPSNNSTLGLPYVSFNTELPVRTDVNKNKLH